MTEPGMAGASAVAGWTHAGIDGLLDPSSYG
jgi:hypothetical protein